MDRRMFLRTALRELELVLTDQPGLLGPKVRFIFKDLGILSVFLSLFFYRHCLCRVLCRVSEFHFLTRFNSILIFKST